MGNGKEKTKRQREEQRKRKVSKEKAFTVLHNFKCTVINTTDVSFVSLKYLFQFETDILITECNDNFQFSESDVF